MTNYNAPENPTTRRILLSACASVLAVAFTVSLSPSVHAGPVTVPSVPPNIEVASDNKVFLVGHGVGTQNYICQPAGAGVAYVLFTPQATLFKDNGRQLTTHFFSPNPFETNTNPAVVAEGMIRVTWQHSRDSSRVWAKVAPDGSALVAGAVAWLKLERVDAEDGPTGGGTLTATTFIQRLNTSGGLAPSMGCASPADVGNQAFVPYTADYFFYKKAPESDAHDDGN